MPASRPARQGLITDWFPYASEILTLRIFRPHLTLLNVQQSVGGRDSCILENEAQTQIVFQEDFKMRKTRCFCIHCRRGSSGKGEEYVMLAMRSSYVSRGSTGLRWLGEITMNMQCRVRNPYLGITRGIQDERSRGEKVRKKEQRIVKEIKALLAAGHTASLPETEAQIRADDTVNTAFPRVALNILTS